MSGANTVLFDILHDNSIRESRPMFTVNHEFLRQFTELELRFFVREFYLSRNNLERKEVEDFRNEIKKTLSTLDQILKE